MTVDIPNVKGSSNIHLNGHVNGRTSSQDSLMANGISGLKPELPLDINGKEPIAIIGMGCRFPGPANSDSELWSLLAEGKDGYRRFPPERMNISAFHHQRQDRAGSTYTEGGFLLDGNPNAFDAPFFGVNASEAQSMDPSQKLLLETVYEAFESSGQTLQMVDSSLTGVFVGNMNNEQLTRFAKDSEYPPPYVSTGSDTAMLSNRVSYLFNLRGPSLTVTTACSSSMTALNLGEMALKDKRCNMAIVAGTNLIQAPELQIYLSKLGALSPSSRCHTYDDRADGYARGEGFAVLILKRLGDALADGDPIRAVIRGSAINANGKTGGITHPSSRGQAEVIKATYEIAGLDTAATGYFEMHGTGTPVGDPIETAGLAMVFGERYRQTGRELLVGSIKPNLGHGEATSGIAGVMKAVHIIEKGIIPPTINIRNWNPKIDFASAGLKVVTSTQALPEPVPGVRRVSVNCFGYGGANGHVILEGASSIVPPEYRPSTRYHCRTSSGNYSDPHESAQLLCFSAYDQAALTRNIDALSNIAYSYRRFDLAHTLASHRTRFRERAYTVANQNTWKRKDCKIATTPRNCGTCMVFTGQGAQWPGMGAQLLKFDTFAVRIRELEEVLRSVGEELDIEEVLRDSSSGKIHDPTYSQPLCTALQIGIVDLLAEWGIFPTGGVVGHSSGEIGAAYAAGHLSAAEAIIAAYFRGKTVLKYNTKKGSMVAVGLGPEAVQPYIDQVKTSSGLIIGIAAVNSPGSVTVSGDEEAVNLIHVLLKKDSVFARILQTKGNAYHSEHMQPLGVPYKEVVEAAWALLPRKASPIVERKTRVPFFSSVTGRKLESEEILNADYWIRNLQSPVLFSPAVNALANALDTTHALIEIGPHAALKSPIQQITTSAGEQGKNIKYFAALFRQDDVQRNLLSLAGELFLLNIPVDIDRVNRVVAQKHDRARVIVDLPNYSWNHERIYDHKSRIFDEWRFRKYPRHDILGSRAPGTGLKGGVVEWRNCLNAKNAAWLKDYRSQSHSLFPASGYLCSAVEALTQLLDDDKTITGYSFRDVSFLAPLYLPDEKDVEILFHLWANDPQSATSWYDFSVTSISGDTSVTHCRGGILAEKRNPAFASKLPQSPAPLQVYPGVHIYQQFEGSELEYGSTFQGLSEITTTEVEELITGHFDAARIYKATELESRYVVQHPAALEVLFQLPIIASKTTSRAMVPTYFGSASIWKSSSNIKGDVISNGKKKGLRACSGSSWLLGVDGTPLASVKDVRFVSSTSASASTEKKLHQPFSHPVWKADISSLDSRAAERLFPPHRTKVSETLFYSLDRLSTHLLLKFLRTSPDLMDDSFQPKSTDMQRFLEWTRVSARCASNGTTPLGREIMAMSDEERELEEQHLRTELWNYSPEARIITRIADNFRDIFTEKVRGMDICLRENLLTALYASTAAIGHAYVQFERLVDLIAHKTPGLAVMELGAGTGGATRHALPILYPKDSARRLSRYVFSDVTTSFLAPAEEQFQEYPGIEYMVFDMETDLEKQNAQALEGQFDLIFASQAVHANGNMTKTLNNIRRLLKPGGKLVLLEVTNDWIHYGIMLGTFGGYWKGFGDGRPTGPFLSRDEWIQAFTNCGYNFDLALIDILPEEASNSHVLVASAPEENLLTLPATEVTLIYLKEPTKIATELKQQLLQGNGVTVQELSMSSAKAGTISGRVILLAELEEPVLANMTTEILEGMKKILSSCTSLLWVTSGGLVHHKRPEFALAAGFIHSISKELPSLKAQVIDLDIESVSVSTTAATLTQASMKIDVCGGYQESEVRLSDDICYLNRMVPDASLNRQFSGICDVRMLPLSQQPPIRLDLKIPGDLRSLYWREDISVKKILEGTDIMVTVKAAGVNPESAASLLGTLDSDTWSSEYAGIVQAVGPAVKTLKVGDRVVCLQPGKYGTIIRTRECLCQKVAENESLMDLSTVPLAYCKVVWALIFGRLKQDESILIQSAGTICGQVAIQLAQSLGASVYATVSSVEQRSYLVETYGLPIERIFADNEIDRIECRFEVVLRLESNSKPWEKATGHLLKSRGRFIDLSKEGSPRMRGNVSFLSLDIEALLEEDPLFVGRLLAMAMEYHSAQKLYPLKNIKVFGLNNIETALKTVAPNKEHAAPVALTYEDDSVSLPVLQSKEAKPFRESASYLMVNSLNATGLALSRWMVAQGARNLVFLDTIEKTDSANGIFAELQSLDAQPTLVTADIMESKDVQRAVERCGSSLRGIVFGPTPAPVQSFERVTVESFASGVLAKIKGCLNLHSATEKLSLDFFVIMNSLVSQTGMKGATISSAADSFANEFARFRRSLGLESVSFQTCLLDGEQVLPEESGFYAVEEAELMTLTRSAFLESTKESAADSFELDGDATAGAILATGLDPERLQELIKGKSIDAAWYHEPQFARILHATKELSSAASENNKHMTERTPAEILQIEDRSEFLKALEASLIHRLAKLLFIKTEEIDVEGELSHYGLDSMIAAEYRTWLARQWNYDVPFLEFIGAGMTVRRLSSEIAARRK